MRQLSKTLLIISCCLLPGICSCKKDKNAAVKKATPANMYTDRIATQRNWHHYIFSGIVTFDTLLQSDVSFGFSKVNDSAFSYMGDTFKYYRFDSMDSIVQFYYDAYTASLNGSHLNQNFMLLYYIAKDSMSYVTYSTTNGTTGNVYNTF